MITSRKTLIVANWKMHKNVNEASLLLHALAGAVQARREIEVVLCPTLLTVQSLSLQINRRQFKLGAQNCYWRDEGAYTGEVSATQLRGVVDYVLVGHSERRHIFRESERDIRAKVQAVIRNNMRPIICVGETAQQHVDKETKSVITDQLVSALANITSEEIGQIVVAYEPVWAIGTGNNATARDVGVVARVIRRQVTALYGADAAESLRVLYGGSTSDLNAELYLAIPEIDGLLVGGASLNPHSFAKIVDVAHNKRKDISKEE